jgi:hypothetical protein
MFLETEDHVESFEFFLDPAEAFLSAGSQSLPWVVEGVIPSRELAVLYGESGSMKSFVALDLAMAIATGKPWHGKAVEKSLVVLISPEGRRGFPLRLQGSLEGVGLTAPPPNFQASDQRVRLNNGEVIASVLRTVEEARRDEEVVKMLGRRAPVVFFIDPLSACMAGTDFKENDSTDMSAVVDGLSKLMTMGTVVLVHHTDKQGSTMKGSYVLDCAAETAIRVTKTKVGVTLTLEHREGVTGEKLTFAADVVPVLNAESGSTTLRLRLLSDAPKSVVSEGSPAKDTPEARLLACIEAARPHGLTRRELSTTTGLSPSTISRLRKKLDGRITTTREGRYILNEWVTDKGAS